MEKLTFEEYVLLDNLIDEYIRTDNEFISSYKTTAIKSLIDLRKDMESQVSSLKVIRAKLSTMEVTR